MSEIHYLFDWGDTLMVDDPGQPGPMCDWPTVAAVDGAAECLAALGRVARCHLATNARDSNRARIRGALQRAGLGHLLERIFCFREVGWMKPAPAYFAHVAQALESPPERLVMVGDALESDVRGALACGLRAVWFNPLGAAVPAGIVAVADLRELAAATAAWRR